MPHQDLSSLVQSLNGTGVIQEHASFVSGKESKQCASNKRCKSSRCSCYADCSAQDSKLCKGRISDA